MIDAPEPISGERLRTAQAIFDAAVELPPNEREAELARRCGGDAPLREFVARLLASADHGLGSFLESTLASATLIDARTADAAVPTRIGPYEITRRIGEGGMGVVYEARQEHPRRTVALKVIRPGFGSTATLRRFRLEADVLGQLRHPGIAHIYDAGIADGVAYFAMEFIVGRPLNEYVTTRALGQSEALEVFTRVCDAVQHAHQQGVIHRDLKPGNILIAEEGGESALAAAPTHAAPRALPKVLDFGVARVVGADSGVISMHTEVGQLVGTIPYMSPEQIAGDSQQVDARSDVYALGVILYELLSGRLPYDVRQRSLVEAARIIREHEPARLSTDTTTIRGARRMDRDIVTIVAKALEKDRARRYQSAADFAADVRRYLNNEPIQARPTTALYQMHKFAQRHRAVVLGFVATIAALAVGLVGTISFALAEREQRGQVERLLTETRSTGEALEKQRRDAEASRDAAHASAAETTAVLSFLLNDVIGATAPEQGGHALTVVQALDASVASIDVRFAERPRVAVLLHERIGQMYGQLGHYESAVRECRRAAELAVGALVDEPGLVLRIELGLVDALADARQWDEVLALAEPLARRAEQLLGPNTVLSLSAATAFGDALQVHGRYAEAEPLLRRTREIAREKFPDDPITLRALNALNACVEAQGRVDEDLRREEYEGTLRRMGPTHPLALVALNNYAVSLIRLEKHSQAEALLFEAIKTLEATLPPGHATIGEVYNNLSTALVRQYRPEEGAAASERAVAILSAAVGEREAGTQRARRQLIRCVVRAGRYAEAEELLRELIAARVAAGDPATAPDLLQLRAELAWNVAEHGGDCSSVDKLLVEVEAHGCGVFDGRDATEMFARLARAWCLLWSGERAAAAAARGELVGALDAAPGEAGFAPAWIRGSCERMERELRRTAEECAATP